MLDTISYTILFCYCSDPKRRTSWYLSRKGFEGLKNLLKSYKGNRAVCRIGISSHTCTLTKPCPRTCCAMWLPVSLSDRPWLGSPTGSPSLGAAPLLGNFLLPHLYPTLLCLADCYLVPRLTFLGSLRDLPHFGLGDLISVHPLFPQSWAMVAML